MKLLFLALIRDFKDGMVKNYAVVRDYVRFLSDLWHFDYNFQAPFIGKGLRKLLYQTSWKAKDVMEIGKLHEALMQLTNALISPPWWKFWRKKEPYDGVVYACGKSQVHPFCFVKYAIVDVQEDLSTLHLLSHELAHLILYLKGRDFYLPDSNYGFEKKDGWLVQKYEDWWFT